MIPLVMGKKRQAKMNIVGAVAVGQVPMVMTFDQNHVNYLAEHLGAALEQAYQVYALFGEMDEGGDPFGE